MATFTTTTEIKNLMGEDGYKDCLSGLTGSSITSFLTWVIAHVTNEIASYTQEFYLDDEISDSPEIRMKATQLAVHLISQRRGNAPLYEVEVERIYEYLDEVRSQKRNLPNKRTYRVEAPIVRNHVINQRYQNKTQVDRQTSSGTHTGEIFSPLDTYLPL